jgi:hypothetical protein
MENKIVVDYDKKIVDLHYEGEVFNFNLNDGDIGDFWHSFTDKNNVTKDINFSQEDAEQQPGLSIYGLKDDGSGYLSIDTSDEVYISNFEQVGNPENYFGKITDDTRYFCQNCGGGFKREEMVFGNDDDIDTDVCTSCAG